jgi:hypothetical protein
MHNLLKLILSGSRDRMLFCLSPLLVFLLFLWQAESCPCLCKGNSNVPASLLIFILRSQLLTVTYPFLNAKYTLHTYKKESHLIESFAFLASPSLSRLVPASKGLSRCQLEVLKVHIYQDYYNVCPLLRIGTSPAPLPQASVFPPETKRGGGALACG